MPREIICKKTRNEFREYFVSTSLRTITMEFDAADVPIDGDFQPSETGQRRCLVEQYYHTVDWSNWKDVRRIIKVYESVLAELDERAKRGEEWAANTFASLKKWIERDGFVYREGHLAYRGDVPNLPDVQELAVAFDAPELHRQIERLRSAVDDDPALAIGTAKELVETTCKTILDDRKVEYDPKSEIGTLVKAVRAELGLIPESIPDSAKGVESIRRLLSNLGNIAQGLGELRNLYGTGHGRTGKSSGLTARHARLAVGAATTLALFLFETHQERT